MGCFGIIKIGFTQVCITCCFPPASLPKPVLYTFLLCTYTTFFFSLFFFFFLVALGVSFRLKLCRTHFLPSSSSSSSLSHFFYKNSSIWRSPLNSLPRFLLIVHTHTPRWTDPKMFEILRESFLGLNHHHHTGIFLKIVVHRWILSLKISPHSTHPHTRWTDPKMFFLKRVVSSSWAWQHKIFFFSFPLATSHTHTQTVFFFGLSFQSFFFFQRRLLLYSSWNTRPFER